MRWWAVAALLTGLTLAVADVGSGWWRRPGPPPGPQLYVALGDSLTFGAGASQPGRDGYVPRVRERLDGRVACSRDGPDGCRLRLRNLGMPGATSSTLVRRQLPTAVAAVEAAPGRVALITVGIGGNDLLALADICLPLGSEGCRGAVAGALERFSGNLSLTLRRLRRAAGDGIPIVVLAYDNTPRYCLPPGAAAFGDRLLEGGRGVGAGLNERVRAVAADHGAAVADAFGALDQADVADEGGCVHPDDSGHAVLAQRFAAAYASVARSRGVPPSRPGSQGAGFRARTRA